MTVFRYVIHTQDKSGMVSLESDTDANALASAAELLGSVALVITWRTVVRPSYRHKGDCELDLHASECPNCNPNGAELEARMTRAEERELWQS